MNVQINKVKKDKIIKTLILHNCLPLGKQAKFTSKNVAQYLLGSRNNYNLFKFNEIKHLLLKFTPLIETIFRSKLVLKAKVGLFHKTRLINPIPPKDPARYQEWYAKMKGIKIAKHLNYYYYKNVENKMPVKILFASTNPTYTKIIKTSAEFCNMTAHTNRWLCGYITANSKPLKQQIKLYKQLDTFEGKSTIERQLDKTFYANKEAKELRYKWHNLNLMAHRPALAIVPDIINNDMILRETDRKNIPVIGLVNSDESTKIAYPIFGNSESIQVVHFFCNFLALLIAKAFIQQEYKQSSHRIFNRTRAYFITKKNKTKTSSVDPFSKKQIILNLQRFPIFHKRTKNLIYPKNFTRKSIKQNLHNFAKIKVIKSNYNFSAKTQSIKQKVLRREYKLKGLKPYWKNLYMMIVTLKLRLGARKHKRHLAVKVKKQSLKKKKKSLKTKQQILTNDFARSFHVKQQLATYQKAIKLDHMLLNKYIKKLAKLTKNKKEKSNKLAFFNSVLNKSDQKLYLTFSKLFTNTTSDNAIFTALTEVKLNQGLTENERDRWWWNRKKRVKKIKTRKWKWRHMSKRKIIVKAFGHQGVARKRSRVITQVDGKLILSTYHIPKYKENTIYDLRILKNIQNKLKKFNNNIYNKQLALSTKIYANLLLQKQRITSMPNLRSTKDMLTKTWSSKYLRQVMLKKYPYFTLISNNLITTKYPTLAKNALTTSFYELYNKKQNPYAFSAKRFKIQRMITNDLIWQKIFWKKLTFKYKKKVFKQSVRRFWFKSKIKFRGLIRRSTGTKSYFFRKVIHLIRKKSVPKFLIKIKQSFRSKSRKLEQKRFKSTQYYIWYKRRSTFKFRRAHRFIPKLARRILPLKKKHKRKSRKELMRQRELDIKKFKKEQIDYNKSKSILRSSYPRSPKGKRQTAKAAGAANNTNSTLD